MFPSREPTVVAPSSARRRPDAERGRPPKNPRDPRRPQPRVDAEPSIDLRAVASEIRGRRVLVLGSAPLARPLSFAAVDYVIAINGSLASMPGRVPDLWLLNSRVREFMHWNRQRRELNQTMLDQCVGRHVRMVGFMNVQDDADRWTRLRLADRDCTFERWMLYPHSTRRMIEIAVGVYRKDEAMKHGLSLGFSAVCLSLWAAAAHVTMRGFSLGRGYHYLTAEENAKLPSNARGHARADYRALGILRTRYTGRLDARMEADHG